MGISYKQASTFTAGQEITAASASLLADAFNTRLKYGVGDPTRRIHQYVYNLFQQIKNPTEPDAFGSQKWFSRGEFSMYFQSLDFDKNLATWPVVPRGTYEGSNTANPAVQFVHGLINAASEVIFDGEGERLSKFGTSFFEPVNSTPEALWNLGKIQRGGYDPTTGNQYWPMGEAAQSHSMITMPYWSKYGKTPGGYLPVPAAPPGGPNTCTDYSTIWFPNQEIKFTLIDPPYTEVKFSGICGVTYGGTAADVAYIWEGPFSWVVYQYDGTRTEFSKADYIEGPYDGGGYLQFDSNGEQINRLMINPFLLGFRGTKEQSKPNCYDVRDIAFSNQEFYESQYLLSPSYATTVGPDLIVTEPTYIFGPGSSVASESVTTTHDVPADFVCGGRLVVPVGLDGVCQIQQLSASVVIDQFTIQEGTASIRCFTTESLRQVQFKLATDANFTSSDGRIDFETLDLFGYKPTLLDGYALLRCASSLGGIGEDSMDTRGKDTTQAKEMYLNYISHSCFLPINGSTEVYQQEISVNTNPVFDAAREYINSFTRVVNGHDLGEPTRKLLVGYEVTAEGRSVLYFRRNLKNTLTLEYDIDMFDGLTEISASAPVAGWTNEWVMFLCGKPYHWSESSIWKKSVYADYFPYINRCLFAPGYPDRINNTQIWEFINQSHPNADIYFRKLYIAPEGPYTAYNYDGEPNSVNPVGNMYTPGDPAGEEWARNFYSSCQIYPADYQVLTASVVVESGEEIVKLEFDRRFASCSIAPSTIARDTATWDRSALDNEPYRTDENIIRQFLLQDNDTYNPLPKTGDAQANSEINYWPDNPYGSVMPTFFFTKLIEKPHIPTATTNESCSACLNLSASIVTADQYVKMETYLKGMCEGFVDDVTSLTNACDTDYNTAWDWTLPNLVYAASSGTRTSLPLLNLSQRPDKPIGYGPLANMEIQAETLNILSRCINLLTKARLPLPWTLQVKTDYYADEEDVTEDLGDTCAEASTYNRAIKYNYTSPAATTLILEGDWQSTNGFTTTVYGSWKPSTEYCVQGICNANLWTMQTLRSVANYRFSLIDPLALYAIPEDIQSLLTTPGSAGFFGKQTYTEITQDAEIYTPTPPGNYDSTTACGTNSHFWFIDGNDIKWTDTSPAPVVSCNFYTSGILDIGETPPQADYGMGSNSSDTFPCQRIACNYGGLKNMEVVVRNTKDIIINVPVE